VKKYSKIKIIIQTPRTVHKPEVITGEIFAKKIIVDKRTIDPVRINEKKQFADREKTI
jgi:hypothetical protein